MHRLIHVFDLDDTMIHSNASVIVYDNAKQKWLQLSPKQYNLLASDIKRNTNRYTNLSFEQFNDIKYMEDATMLPMYKVFKALYVAGLDVAIITSRESPDLIHSWLNKCCNIILPKCRVICVNEYKQADNNTADSIMTDAQLKKEAILKLFQEEGFDTFVVYDDCPEFNAAMRSAMDDAPINVITESHFLSAFPEK